MKLRTRLTLWYAGVLFASTFLITALTYRELANDATASQNPRQAAEEEQEKEEVVDIILFCAIPAALLGLGGGWWLMRKAMAPIIKITEAAAGIHEQNLRERLPRSGNGDEFDRLTEVFNDMTARLERSFGRIRDFTLHASHELKTPLTVMRAELETALREETNPAQRERLGSQLDEVLRLSKIVEGLNLLTKADAGQIHLERKPVRLDELVNDSVEDARILAQAKEITIEVGACEALTIHGDRHRLRQLLLNLVDNAIKYNYKGGRVSISLRREGKSSQLRMSNTGPGVPPEIQERVFDHFFRGDPSHNGEVEGCGLGLSIARWIVTAHDGAISFQSKPKEETTVTVELPLG